jgi:sulfide:quinone oxidoreductase
MAKVLVIGAGFAGHTTALYLGNKLGRKHEVTAISNRDVFSYIPSWVWVGVGHMKPEKTVFKLKPIYDRMHVKFVHAAATEVHPDAGDQYVIGEEIGTGNQVRLDYDYLVIAPGPLLNFAGTPGLGPERGYTHSICSLPHAVKTRDAYLALIERMQKGEKVKIVIGTGHPAATCQGAAFEYIVNVHKDLVKKNLRHKADILWLSNEPALGDFGVNGVQVKRGGHVLKSEEFIRAVFNDHAIRYQVQSGVTRVEEGKIHWQNFEGEEGITEFDFSMLIPQFKGQPIQYIGKDGSDISSKLVNPAGFVLVDGTYGLPYSELAQIPEAWPAHYNNPNYPNIFSAGIAFAPPGPISKPFTNKNDLAITPAPPRTGMVSGVIGRVVAMNIVDLIEKGEMTHSERMTEMVAACIASMGDNLWDGNAVTIVMRPVVPDRKKYQNEYGRDLFISHLEMGLSGAWMKFVLHHTFFWKFKALPGWKLIPE